MGKLEREVKRVESLAGFISKELQDMSTGVDNDSKRLDNAELTLKKTSEQLAAADSDLLK